MPGEKLIGKHPPRTAAGYGSSSGSLIISVAIPIPGEKLIEAGDRMIGDATQDVCEPGLRVDAVELGGGDQGVHCGSALAAAIGPGEQPRLAPERDAA